MKLLMTADPIGGVWTYALELANALAPRGVTTTLATMGAPLSAEQRAEAARAARVALRESSFALEWMPDPWSDVGRAGEWLLELADEVEPDVVHLNGYAHAALPWRAPVVVGAHSDVLSWWEAVRRAPAPDEWRTYRAAVERGLRAADVVVAPTAAMLRALERHYAFHSPRLAIPNGLPRVAAQPKRPYVVAVGRFWDDAKNGTALRRVEGRISWPIRYAGGDTWLGRDAVEELVARAAVFAAPARYEPFGLSAVAAGSARCALVLGDLESLREVWDDAAVYVDPDDDDALARALERLIHDDALRASYGARAAERAARYTPDRMADAYASLYRSLTRETVAA